jgi:hypothetical protein
MGRIRHVKPDFFKHEKLNDLENNHPEKRPMLVFAGLWCQCDSDGAFRWRPRSLKLEILPFVEFNIESTLELLIDEGFIIRYQSNGNEVGKVIRFMEHQYTNPKEKRLTAARNLSGEHTISENEQESPDQGKEPENDNDLNLTGIVSKFEVIKEKMLGEIWIEQACVTNGFDKEKFTGFIKTWLENHKLTETLTYPVNKCKLFVILDYQKANKGNGNNGKSVIGKRNSAYVAP